MTEKDLLKYITRLNQKNGKNTIYTREIANHIELARVWDKLPRSSDNINKNNKSYRIFFIKDEKDKYIGAVLDSIYDLHWYILAKSRKKGYLTRALSESIMPYLFFEREEQTISIDRYEIGDKNYQNSKKLALNIGFEPTNEDESEFILKSEKFNHNNDNISEKNKLISDERLEFLKIKSQYASKLLMSISDELKMSCNNDGRIAEKYEGTKHLFWIIEDIIRNNNELLEDSKDQ